MTQIKKEAAGVGMSTAGLVEELLTLAAGANSSLTSIDNLEIMIHEAKADGDPVSSGANDVISILDQVRPHLEKALDILLDRVGSITGKPTPEPLPIEEEEPELEDEEEFEEVEELPPEGE